MAERTEFRRYLVNIDSISTHQLFTDCLVIGAGIAGLRAAIEAAEHCNVIIVCKGTQENSNTAKAQGGIASVLDKADTFEAHIADTLKTGCGICDESIVELVVRQGPELVDQLLRWGTEFDLIKGHIATTLEGGHSHPRIAHAHGDETGRVIAKALTNKVKQSSNIRILENFYAIDLLTNDENKCVGIVGHDNRRGPQIIWAANTILASGGAGQLYRETTNPEVATGDGIAIAYRAGTVLQDLEYHESAELAPRDIVSRAILSQMLKTESTHVYLDVRHFDRTYFTQRFPQINELLKSFDIDISRDLIPVRPSAHYMIGGVKTDSSAKTSIENLYACGEIASTGLHGANRLGSNSLLEGLVFGKTAGRAVSQSTKAGTAHIKHPSIKYQIPHSDRTRLDTVDVRNSLRALMWRNVGITRWGQMLAETQEIIKFWQRYVMDKIFDSPQGWECQNMLTACLLMAQSAEMRQESRGVHFRSDFPKTDDKNYKKHIEISKKLSDK